MRPVLVQCGNIPIPSYYALFVLGLAVSVALTLREDSRSRSPIGLGPEVGVAILLGAILGAHLYSLCENASTFGWRDAIDIFEGGLVFYGGFAGAVTFVVAYAWLRRLPVRRTLDLMAPFVALGGAFTRIGCFLNGCCWGKPTMLPWACHFPATTWGAYTQHLASGLIRPGAPYSLYVHPTQLYSIAGFVLLYVVLLWYLRKERNPGRTFLLFLVLYSVGRFAVEFLRADSNIVLGPLTLAQVISLSIFVVAFPVLAIAEVRQAGSRA